jgi:hypothetical protein
MIILKDVPFERRAQFLHDSICGYPDNPEFGQALSEHTADREIHDIDIAGGLQAHHDLLRRMYADVACIEGQSDEKKYLDLVATMTFLYAVFAFGTLVHEHDQYSVRIDKAVLKQQYKKGSLAKRKHHLEHHGFPIKYLSAQGECRSLSKAAQLSLAYDRHPHLVPAVKHFAESIASIQEGRQKCTYNKLGIFVKGDYEAGILRKPIPRDALDPLRSDLLDTVDEYKQPWMDLVDALRNKCDLACSGFWTYGGTPSWGVSFFAKGKKPLAIFTLGSNIVFIEFTLPVSSAERIIRERKSYSEPIREKIEAFHCVQCPKKCKGSNLTKVDGVWLCTGRAEARRIYATLTFPQDFESIHSMIDIIC